MTASAGAGNMTNAGPNRQPDPALQEYRLSSGRVPLWCAVFHQETCSQTSR